MKTLTTLVTAGLLASSAIGAQATVTEAQLAAVDARRPQVSSLFNRQSREADAFTSQGLRRAVAARTPDHQLPQSVTINYLELPDGTQWLYTLEYYSDKVEHESYTETLLNGFKMTIYDADFNEVGTVSDHISLAEGETRIAQISIDPVLTKGFFNYDAQYELMVLVSANTPSYDVNNYTLVYSIGTPANSDGDTEPIARMDGIVCSSINAAQDAWSENFYLTFVTETGYDPDASTLAEMAASKKYVTTTYKKASWGGEPQAIGTHEVSVACLPGDLMSCPFFFSTLIDGKPTFIVQHYEKWFFNNAVGPGLSYDEDADPNEGMPFDDNNLLVDVYTYSGYGSEMTLDHTTKVFADQADSNPNVMFCYYGIGNLLYEGDYRADGSLLMSIYKYQITDDDNYLETYALYNAQGELETYLIEDCTSYMRMSDIDGLDPQVMFVTLGDSVSDDDGLITSTSARYTFVNLNTGLIDFEIPSAVNGQTIKVNVDRVRYGNSCRYAFESMSVGSDSDGNTLGRIIWLDDKGQFAALDELNLGQNVAMAQVYIEHTALNPYLFDTNEAREYMWLVKRYRSNISSATDTELIIVNTDGETIFSVGPDAEKGNLITVSLLNTGSTPSLWVSYVDADYNYAQDFYTLPLNSFSLGGNGTADNPYRIATFGDFNLIRNNMRAHYSVEQDLDASAADFTYMAGSFTGTINGNGHSISGLRLNDRGAIFASLGEGCVIDNLRFINTTIGGTATSQGILASDASAARISGIHVYGLQAQPQSTPTIGAIVGTASNYTTITGCSVTSALINAPGSNDVGGIVGDLRTAAKVNTSSFAGQIIGEQSVGGIVGSMNSDNTVTDCHVDADIEAMHTVGGIAGYGANSVINHCHVEGSITAKGSTVLSSSADFGPRAGGVIGVLKPDYQTATGTSTTPAAPDETPLITYNYVNLYGLTGYTPEVAPEFEEQHTTLHRIAGRTSINETPAEDHAAWTADIRIHHNYAHAALAPVSTTVADDHSTTEGASVAADQLSQQWFAETIGLEFGQDKAWNEESTTAPVLNHEATNFCPTAEYTAEENTSFGVSVVFTGREILTLESAADRFSFSCDENIIAPNGQMSLSNNVLTVDFDAISQGTTTLDICGAQCSVTVIPNMGVSSAVTDAATSLITITGQGITAPGCQIALYNTAGICVAAAADFLGFSQLTPGVYIATASGAATSEARKIIIR